MKLDFKQKMFFEKIQIFEHKSDLMRQLITFEVKLVRTQGIPGLTGVRLTGREE